MTKVLFYPVGNGDTSQVVLPNGRRLLFDFRHLACAEDASTPEIDLKRQLKGELKASKRNHFDVVAFTHGDQDHIQGSTDFFELQHSARHQSSERVQMRELWLPAAMLLADTAEEATEEELLLCKEGWHRLLNGQGIRVFSRPKALIDRLTKKLLARGEASSARDHLFVDAGQLVPGFSLAADGAEVFCHSPFIVHCDDGDYIRNEASLVFNVRMIVDGVVYDYLEVGDSDWEALGGIVAATKAHHNDDRLAWDIFNIPHHCSYTALSSEKGSKETEPMPLVKELLLMGESDAYIVSSSAPIPNTRQAYDAVQPPHIQAKNTYVRYLRQCGGRRFVVTMEEPNATKPEPTEFHLTGQGISLVRPPTTAAGTIVSIVPPRAG